MIFISSRLVNIIVDYMFPLKTIFTFTSTPKLFIGADDIQYLQRILVANNIYSTRAPRTGNSKSSLIQPTLGHILAGPLRELVGHGRHVGTQRKGVGDLRRWSDREFSLYL